MEFEFREAQTDENSLIAYSNLLSQVFPNTDKYTVDFLKWQYVNNPFGKVVGFDAFYEGKLVAHYVTIPVEYIFGNIVYKGLLSLNTATLADFQGKGLFTKLAEKTYQLGTEKGYQFIVGVANQNSTHGFIKKLGFKLISPLDAYIYLNQKRIENNLLNYFQSHCTHDFVLWRTKNPSGSYFFSKGLIYSGTDYKFIKANLSVIKKTSANSNLPLCFKMSIGLNNKPKNIFKFKIPNKLKPSPLNLIFKELSPIGIDINESNILFELIDFDAY